MGMQKKHYLLFSLAIICHNSIHPSYALHALMVVGPLLDIKVNHTFNNQVSNMDQRLVFSKQKYRAK